MVQVVSKELVPRLVRAFSLLPREWEIGTLMVQNAVDRSRKKAGEESSISVSC